MAKKEIAALQELLSHRQKEVDALAAANEGLRLRLCGLHVCARVLSEVSAHRAAHGTPDAQLDAQLARVRQLVDNIQAGGGGGGSAGGGGSSSCLSGGGDAGGAGGSATGGGASGAADSAGDGWDARAFARPRRSSGADGGSSSAAGGSVRSSATWPYDLFGLLQAAPHLAPGQSLTHLDDATPEMVQEARSATEQSTRAKWLAMLADAGAAAAAADAAKAAAAAALAPGAASAAPSASVTASGPASSSGLPHGGPAGEGGPAASEARSAAEAAAAGAAAAVEALSDLGRRMMTFFQLMLIWSPDLHLRIGCSNYSTGQASFGTTDAPLTHWESVARAARLTRAQARLAVDLNQHWRGQVAGLLREREALLADLQAAHGAAERALGAPQSATAAAAGARGGSGGGGGGSAGCDGAACPLPDDAADVLTDLEANTAAERATICTSSLVGPVIASPAQFARLWAATSPWPLNGSKLCSVWAHDLKFRPDTFAERAE